MLKTMIQPSRSMVNFLLLLHLRLSKPQRAHLLRLSEALVVCQELHKTWAWRRCGVQTARAVSSIQAIALMPCMMMCVSILTIAEKKLGQNDRNVIVKIAANQIHHCCDQRGRDLRAWIMEYLPQHIIICGLVLLDSIETHQFS